MLSRIYWLQTYIENNVNTAMKQHKIWYKYNGVLPANW